MTAPTSPPGSIARLRREPVEPHHRPVEAEHSAPTTAGTAREPVPCALTAMAGEFCGTTVPMDSGDDRLPGRHQDVHGRRPAVPGGAGR